MRYLKYAIYFFALLLVATFYHRTQMYDDAWFAEQSYLLLQNGKIHSEFFRGLLGWENHIFAAHKGFIVLGAVIMKFTDISLYGSKSVGVFGLLLLVFGFWKYFKTFYAMPKSSLEAKTLTNFTPFLVALFLLLANGLVIEYSFVNRPEMFMSALGLGSFYFLRKNEHWQNIAFSAVLAALALLLHLYGVIYLIAGGLWLLWQKQWKYTFIWGLVGASVSGLYFTDILFYHGFDTWIYQFTHDPATVEAMNWKRKLEIMLNVQEVFFFSDKHFPLSLLVIMASVISFKKNNQARAVQVYGFCLLISYMLITKGFAHYYSLLFVPFEILWIIESLYSTNDQIPRKQLIPLKIVVAIYTLIGFFNASKIIYGNITQPFSSIRNQQIALNIPHGSRLIAPLSFFFNEYPHYTIRGQMYFFFLNQNQYQNKMTVETFFQLAFKQKIDYIIFDSDFDDGSYFPKKNQTTIGVYKCIYWNGRVSIFKQF